MSGSFGRGRPLGVLPSAYSYRQVRSSSTIWAISSSGWPQRVTPSRSSVWAVAESGGSWLISTANLRQLIRPAQNDVS